MSFQGRKLTLLGRRQLTTDHFFQSPNGKMWATSCEILVTSAKFLVALATRTAQFPTLHSPMVFIKRQSGVQEKWPIWPHLISSLQHDVTSGKNLSKFSFAFLVYNIFKIISKIFLF